MKTTFKKSFKKDSESEFLKIDEIFKKNLGKQINNQIAFTKAKNNLDTETSQNRKPVFWSFRSWSVFATGLSVLIIIFGLFTIFNQSNKSLLQNPIISLAQARENIKTQYSWINELKGTSLDGDPTIIHTKYIDSKIEISNSSNEVKVEKWFQVNDLVRTKIIQEDSNSKIESYDDGISLLSYDSSTKQTTKTESPISSPILAFEAGRFDINEYNEIYNLINDSQKNYKLSNTDSKLIITYTDFSEDLILEKYLYFNTDTYELSKFEVFQVDEISNEKTLKLTRQYLIIEKLDLDKNQIEDLFRFEY